MQNTLLEVVELVLKNEKAVKFAYLFGSHVQGRVGPLSDIDIAVYLDKRYDLFVCRLLLMEEIDRCLKGHPCDLVVLNNAPVDFQYDIIKNGQVLKDDKRKRVPFEVRVLRQYLDFEPFRGIHLAKLKRSFQGKTDLG